MEEIVWGFEPTNIFCYSHRSPKSSWLRKVIPEDLNSNCILVKNDALSVESFALMVLHGHVVSCDLFSASLISQSIPKQFKPNIKKKRKIRLSKVFQMAFKGNLIPGFLFLVHELNRVSCIIPMWLSGWY